MRPRKTALLFCYLLSVSPFLHADNLSDIYELALQNDAQLRAAEATFKARLEAEVQSRSSLLPQLSANASFGDGKEKGSQSRSLILNGDQVINQNSDKSNDEREDYSITLRQNLFDLSAWFAFKEGKALSKEASARFAADQQDLIVRVAEAYFDVLRAHDNLATSKAEEAAIKRQLEQSQRRYDAGLAAITDVHETQAAYDLAVAMRLADEGNLGIALESLSVLTNREHGDLWQLDERYPTAMPVPSDNSTWVAQALQNNYRLKAAALAAEAAEQNARAKKSEHLPTVSATISYYDDSREGNSYDYNLNRDKPFSSDNEGHTITLNIDMPLYSGGNISSARRQAYQESIAAKENRDFIRRNTIRETRSLYLTVTTAATRARAYQQSIRSAESALQATRSGYNVGTRNIVDVLNAQQVLYRARRDYANSRYDHIIGTLKLKREAGNLSPEDIYQLNNWLAAEQRSD